MSQKFEHSNQNHPPTALNIPHRNESLLATYTAMRMLRQMRGQLGLEAMLEYMEHYTQSVNSVNPRLSFAVSKALTLISMEKIYKDARCGKNII